MQIKVVVHEAEEGGFWAEVPAIPGCASQGDRMDELMLNLREAIVGGLSIEVEPPSRVASSRCWACLHEVGVRPCDFARIVERRGWTLLRISGSHHIYGKVGSTPSFKD
jgi:predicted RNase H-like HicB family nuclease